MRAVRSAALTAFAHLSKILVGFYALKLIALYLGMEGLGYIGHFMSLVTICVYLSGGGILNGVIKYVSEYRGARLKLHRFITAAGAYALLYSLLALVVCLVFSVEISVFIFKKEEYFWIILFLGVGQFALALVVLVTGVANGMQKTEVFANIQIVGALLSVPIIWLLIKYYGVAGAALSVFCIFVLPAFPAFFYFRKSPYWRRVNRFLPDKTQFRRLFSFTLMAVVSAAAFPVTEILVRESIISSHGYSAAGIWQGSMRLSNAYLGFFNIFLAYYFMPLISAELDVLRIRREVVRFSMAVMVLFTCGALTLYIWRNFFISMFLSESFSSLGDLIIYQLIGDFFKISSYVVCFVGVAKAATKLYIAGEILQCLLFLVCAYLFGRQYSGVEGVMIGYAFGYFTFFCIVVGAFVRYVSVSRQAPVALANQ